MLYHRSSTKSNKSFRPRTVATALKHGYNTPSVTIATKTVDEVVATLKPKQRRKSSVEKLLEWIEDLGPKCERVDISSANKNTAGIVVMVTPPAKD